jgi:ABC-2 type transport system ATP-binding protein
MRNKEYNMIEIKDLSFKYKKKDNLFSGLNLSVPGGNIYGLLGKNGAGKTTLLKIMAGLLFAQEGESKILGMPSRLRLPGMLEEIYFIPEEFYTPSITTKMYEKFYSPFYPRFSHDDFAQFLREFEVESGSNLGTMSYGQKKKFLIAFGLATGCNLLILDEPTNGLDIPSKSQFRKLLATTLTDERTFIISTHQVRDMQNLIDPIIILENGTIIFQQDIFSVSQKLKVKLQDSEPEEQKVLYSEKVLGGFTVVEENHDNEETQIDLELLFNAVLKNKEKMSTLFAKEVS